MSNRSDIAFANRRMLLCIADPDGFCDATQEKGVEDLNEYDEAIAEAAAMLDYSFGIPGGQTEVVFWRNYLQQLKTEKRMLIRELKARNVILHSGGAIA